jgi:small subunit ribosomal protein S14
MAKKSMVERERKRKNLVARYRLKRESIIMELKRAHLKGLSFDEIAPLNKILQKLPKNSSPQRQRNRCWKTGRPRGYFRFFGLCRNVLREMTHDCFLPGVTKSSW